MDGHQKRLDKKKKEYEGGTKEWTNGCRKRPDNKQTNKQTNEQTDGRRKMTRQKNEQKKERNERGTNVIFYYRWQKCRFIIGGTKVDFTIGGTNSAMAETSWWYKRRWH